MFFMQHILDGVSDLTWKGDPIVDSESYLVIQLHEINFESAKKKLQKMGTLFCQMKMFFPLCKKITIS